MRPVLLLEVNEVPLRVYQKYAGDPRFPNIRKLLNESVQLDTLISDEGELSPWCTWPTIHRGMSKRDHGIFHLGQDPATFRGTPIWDEYLKRGLSVGVFGSLQSWPPKDPGAGGFYIPDTFAPSPECRPNWIEPIQALNLGLVRENGRVMVDGLVSHALNPGLWLSLIRAGVRPSTLARSFFQVVREKFQPMFRQRRVSFQALLFWDIFRGLYNPLRPPAFATFFTNHIASVEHRFWNHVFPEDFSAKPANREHLATMDFAIKIADEILGEAFEWRRQNPEIILVVANSMGQGARVSKKHEGFELSVKNISQLFSTLGVPPGLKQNLAMAPQLTFDVENSIDPALFVQKLSALTCRSGRKILLCESLNKTVTVSVSTPPSNEIEGDVFLLGGREVGISELGMERLAVDPGTAYHVPEGQIFVQGLETSSLPKKKLVPAEDVKSLLLAWAEISPSDTYGKTPEIRV